MGGATTFVKALREHMPCVTARCAHCSLRLAVHSFCVKVCVGCSCSLDHAGVHAPATSLMPATCGHESKQACKRQTSMHVPATFPPLPPPCCPGLWSKMANEGDFSTLWLQESAQQLRYPVPPRVHRKVRRSETIQALQIDHTVHTAMYQRHTSVARL